MKTILVLFTVLALAASGCKKEAVASGNPTNGQLNTFPKEPLSDDEKLSLAWMREEEKLAHDVYITLYKKWNKQIFNNIAASERQHMQSVLDLLDRYGIPDPVGSNPVGVFKDPAIQTLYRQLVEKGSRSELEGLVIGATIEDMDIYDLNLWLTKVDNKDIQFVYNNLAKGSRNHLRSFYGQIINAGGSYTAIYMSQTTLEQIINSPKETGG